MADLIGAHIRVRGPADAHFRRAIGSVTLRDALPGAAWFDSFMPRLIFLLLVLPLAAIAAPAHQDVDEVGVAREVLVLGRVSDNPRRHAESMLPMLDYVVPRMRSVGIREGRILMARDAHQMQSYLRRQRVDWVSETAGMATEYQRRVGAQLLLLSDRGGAHYHGVFLTWKGSGITSLELLRGHSIAFQNAYSTSSYVLPAAALLREGIELDVLLSPLDRPAPGRVGYLFSRREENILTWVQKRLVDAGAFSNLDLEFAEQRHPGISADLEIFHRTRDVPRAIEVVAPGLAPAVRERLREVLLAAGDDPAATATLARFFGTRRFLPIDEQSEQELGELRADIELVRERLE